MDKREDSKLYMYDTVITGCDEDNTIPPIVPAFDAQLTTFKDKVTDIHDKVVERDKDITGTTADKKTVKRNNSILFAGVANSVASYAASIGDNVLKEEMNWTEAKLFKVKDEEFDGKLGLIHDRANTNLAALATFGITAATITALDTSRTLWNTVKAKPQSAKGGRKALDIAIETLFKDCDKLLKDQLDKSIAPFRTSHPDFYNAYFANRNIIDGPSSPTQFSGKVVIKGTTTGIPLVEVEVLGTSFKVVTDINGAFALKCPKPGIKNIKASAEGFKEVVLNNHLLKLGQTTPLNIEMEANS